MKPKYAEWTETNAWDEVVETGGTWLILKHSTACPISGAAFQEFNILAGLPQKKFKPVLIKVIESRPVSNRITEATGVTHESPQALLIVDGEVRWHASHWKVTFEAMKEALSRK